MNRAELTADKQQAVLKAVHTLLQQGKLPDMRSIGKLTGLHSTSTVRDHLRVLAARGHLKRYRYGSGCVFLPGIWSDDSWAT